MGNLQSWSAVRVAVPSTRPIALTIACHRLVSSASCLRPAAVRR